MPDDTMMGRVAERARQLYSQGKALVAPLDSEAQALKEKQQNIDEATQPAPEVPKMNYMPAPSDYVHPGMKYGDKPGEQRLPSYQEGGDVPEDQTAKLDRGERVLNPEEAAAYRQAEQEVDVVPEQMKYEGQTVDVGGAKAIPNPKGIKPMMDTDKPEFKPDYNMYGAKMRTDNAPLGRPVMSEHNTPVPGVAEPAMMQEISTKEPVIEQPKYSGATDRDTPTPDTSVYTPQMGEPNAMMGAARQPGALESAMEKQRTPEQAMLEQIDQDKIQAAAKGDLVGLGMANIHERMVRASQAQDKAELPQPTPPTARENIVNQEKMLRDKMLNDPTEQGRFQAEKDLAELRRRTPWGTEGSAHPGVMGKIGHVLGGIGQAAAMGTVPYALPMIPGTQANIAKQEAIGEQGVEAAQKKEATAAETGLKEAQTRAAGMGTTVPEKVYNWAMKGNNGQPMINPDTQKPYTPPEAQTLSTGEGKNVAEQLARALIHKVNPETGKNYTPDEALVEAMKEQAGTRLNEHQKRVADYLASHNMEDSPENREKARIAIETADTEAKQEAALPFAEQKAKFNDKLATSRALLVQQNADANTRGLEADKLQNTENARFSKINGAIEMALNTLHDSDESQFAANIVPVLTLLTTTSEAGVKRVNKQELDKFLPADGSLGRWASAHADKFLAGEIPPEYRDEVGHFLTRMQAAQNAEHTINSHSIDNTIRVGGQEPVQKPEGGAAAMPKKSESKVTPPPEAPAAGGAGGFASWKAAQKPAGQ